MAVDYMAPALIPTLPRPSLRPSTHRLHCPTPSLIPTSTLHVTPSQSPSQLPPTPTPRDTTSPSDSSPVGSCLQLFWQVWDSKGMDPFIVSMLQKGYVIPFLQTPTLSSKPINFPSYQKGSIRHKVLRQAVVEMIDKQVIELVKNPSPGYYSRLFVVPKKEGKWRPVIDLSPLNKMVDVQHFKMETVASVLSSVQPNQWMTSIDLTDAYFHIPIHPRSRRYLRFVFFGKVFQFRSLCFGLSTAPMIFTQVMAPVARMAHREGIRLHQYLDDWLIVATSREESSRCTDRMLHLSQELGLRVNMNKSDLVPDTKTKYLGVVIDSVAYRAYPTPERIINLLKITQRFLLAELLPVWMWLTLLGHLSSLEKLVLNGRRRLRPIQFQLKTFWKYPQDKNHKVIIDSSTKLAIKWWSQEDRLHQGISLQPFTSDFQIYTDASKEGWGAVLNDLTAAGLWTPQESLLHINLLELEAVHRGLKDFQLFLLDSSVSIMSDNTTVVSYINHQGGTKSKSLCLQTIRLLDWADNHRITLKSSFVPGHLNVKADALSRQNQILKQEWSLLQEVFVQICRVWETPHVDLFATNLNHKLPLYFSPIPDDQALGVDSMLQSWRGIVGYAYPPTTMIRAVLNKVRLDATSIILVAPLWPRQEWFPDLLDLLIDLPRQLPHHHRLLRQAHNWTFHNQPASLNLHAWRLSSDASNRRKGFLTKLQRSSPNIIENQLARSTTQGGDPSLIGVTEGRLIHSLPLYQ